MTWLINKMEGMVKYLSLIEYLYVFSCCFIYYMGGGATKPVTVALGYLACLAFIPAYPVLVVGAKLIGVKEIFLSSLISASLLFVIQYFFDGAEIFDMCAFFILSYAASRSFRFFLTIVIG